MKSKVCFGYFVHDRSYQILASAMLEFPINLYLHSLLFVLCLTWNKRLLVQHSIMISGFKRSCVIDILHTSIYHQSEQMNQNNIRDDRIVHMKLQIILVKRNFVQDKRQHKACQLHLNEYVLQDVLCFLNPFSTDVPLTDKPGSLFY